MAQETQCDHMQKILCIVLTVDALNTVVLMTEKVASYTRAKK